MWFYSFHFCRVIFLIVKFFLLPIHIAFGSYQDQLRSRIRKREEVDMEFYGTSGMIDKNWKKANQEQRQVVTRFTVHGFHHKLCKNKKNSQSNCGLGVWVMRK